MKRVLILLYLMAIVGANYIAFFVGQWGLVITASLLIPFDFVLRAYFHETWTGRRLLRNLTLLIGSGALLTLVINVETLHIAVGSFLGFTLAGLSASLFYQSTIESGYFYKVNGSDLVAIVVDSFVFQYVAFSDVSLPVMVSQITMKFLGGLMWYWVLFVRVRVQERW